MAIMFIFGGAISAMFFLMLLVYLGERHIAKNSNTTRSSRDKKKGRKPL